MESENSLGKRVKSILLAYSHWEGGIKEVSTIYLHHVEQQKSIRGNLKSNFLALESITAIKQASSSNDLLPYMQAVDHLIYNLNLSFKLPNIKLIDSESNLSSKVLRNVLTCLGLLEHWHFFESKQRLIDVSILKTRNEIAHNGRTVDREDVDLAPIIGAILELLKIFKDLVENAAATKAYLKQ